MKQWNRSQRTLSSRWWQINYWRCRLAVTVLLSAGQAKSAVSLHQHPWFIASNNTSPPLSPPLSSRALSGSSPPCQADTLSLPLLFLTWRQTRAQNHLPFDLLIYTPSFFFFFCDSLFTRPNLKLDCMWWYVLTSRTCPVAGAVWRIDSSSRWGQPLINIWPAPRRGFKGVISDEHLLTFFPWGWVGKWEEMVSNAYVRRSWLLKRHFKEPGK